MIPVSPEFLLIGLLAILFIVALRYKSPEEKKYAERVAKVVTPTKQKISSQSNSLVRRDPNADSALGQKLAQYPMIEKIQQRMEIAGMTSTPVQLLTYMALITMGSFIVMVVVLGKGLMLAVPMALLLGIFFPYKIIGGRLRKRQDKFLSSFPTAIELIVRGLRAGLPVGESFQAVAREIPGPLGEIFARVNQQVALGTPLEDALNIAAERLDITEFNFFVTVVILQRETGGNLGEILTTLGEMLRQRQMMKLKIHAMSSEARMSAYILGGMPVVVSGLLMVAAPEYLEPLWTTHGGKKAMMGAGISMVIGVLTMKRMIKFKI